MTKIMPVLLMSRANRGSEGTIFTQKNEDALTKT